jgi:hypothetical protein
MKYLAIILIFIHSVALADDAKYLTKDTPAPFTGYLISPEKAEKVRLMDIDLKAALKTNQLLQGENDLLEQRLQNMTTANVELAKQINDNSIWGKVGIFVLGAATATVIAFAAVRAVR